MSPLRQCGPYEKSLWQLTQPQSFDGLLSGEGGGKTLDECWEIFPVPAVEEIFSIRHNFSTLTKHKGKELRAKLETD